MSSLLYMALSFDHEEARSDTETLGTTGRSTHLVSSD